jgi:Lar family restriction alleviation protein
MSDKLLPCPFCGGEAERVDIEEGENAGGSCICCTVCQASGYIEFGRKDNFVSNWNRRAALSAATPEKQP